MIDIDDSVIPNTNVKVHKNFIHSKSDFIYGADKYGSSRIFGIILASIMLATEDYLGDLTHF